MNTDILSTAVQTYIICWKCHSPLYFYQYDRSFMMPDGPAHRPLNLDEQLAKSGWKECRDKEGKAAAICRHCRLTDENPMIGDLEDALYIKVAIKCVNDECGKEGLFDLMGARMGMYASHRASEMLAEQGWTVEYVRNDGTVAYCPECSAKRKK